MSFRDSSTNPQGFRGTQIRDDGAGPMLVAHRQRLMVVDGPDRGLQFEFEGTRLAIGTSSKNDLVLTDGTVSRIHCEIVVRNDRYVVRDLESTNGTLVNDTPVVEAFLPPGARIKLGSTEILFEPQKKWERVRATESDHFGELFGTSDVMRNVFAMLGKVAPTDLSCILIGETGSGKELAARAIHSQSPRVESTFVVVDCGAISQNLIESELFGHEKGSFTGADRMRQGAFELSDGGTIFLDEIGELPLDLQPKLLRALERREVKRLGAARPMEVDVRVVAATHRDLAAMIKQGKFREDLYYRLAEVVIELPPLRERAKDIPLIVQRVLEQEATRGSTVRRIDSEAMRELLLRAWPGNVRELRNVLRRGLAMATGDTLRLADLQALGRSVRPSQPPPIPLAALTGAGSSPAPGGNAPSLEVAEELPIKEAREQWVAPMEREYLVRLLKRCGGDLDRASQAAGLHRKSLERLLRQHGLKASDLRED